MIILLLIIIYIAFISLGLPDSIFGVAWPAMRIEFGLPLDTVGYISIVGLSMTILSSLLNGYIVRRIGTAKLVLFSCILTGSALIGISMVPSFWWIIPLGAALGFGGGSVDASLNNYVAQNFKSKHMNWLHSFWGVGATSGPIIMGMFLVNNSWRGGYRTIGFIQLFLATILFLSLPLWKLKKDIHVEQNDSEPDKKLFRLVGVKLALLTFFIYVSVEMVVGLWGSSYLVNNGFPISEAANLVAVYFGGITIGRIISGFISIKTDNRLMIRYGVLIALLGSVLVFTQYSNLTSIVGFVLLGFGFAPIFPSMVHETPKSFGLHNSAIIIGFQMAAAYAGGGLMPPLMGVLFRNTSVNYFPAATVAFVSSLLVVTEIMFLRVRRTKDELQ